MEPVTRTKTKIQDFLVNWTKTRTEIKQPTEENAASKCCVAS